MNLKRHNSDCTVLQSKPVPIEPQVTLRKRVEDASKGLVDIHTGGEKVPPQWCDEKNVHVLLYVDLGKGEYCCLLLQKCH